MSTETCRKSYEIPLEVNGTERLVTGYISTIDVDTDGDVVLPMGVNTGAYFDTTRSVNLDHRPTHVVGTNVNLAKRAKGLYATTYVSRNALGEDVLVMLKEGVIRGMSIEWNPRTLQTRKPDKAEKSMYGEGCNRIFEKWDLTGYAFTARPANPFCVVDGIKGQQDEIDADTCKRLETLFTTGKIHRSSAVAAGFPDTAERKTFAVAETAGAKRSVVFAGGVVWRKRA